MMIGLYVLQALLGIAFGLSGAAKIAGARMHVNNFHKWGLSQQARRNVGWVELIGAIAVVIGIWVHLLGLLGGLAILATMIGAVGVHRRAKDPRSQWMPAIVFLLVSAAIVITYIAELF